ncbi:hypothetical protein AAVH_29841 [Aphelenchoides avenae]|nr:hypothetical protein AAVH_29841 [Aphelenchus avenae]
MKAMQYAWDHGAEISGLKGVRRMLYSKQAEFVFWDHYFQETLRLYADVVDWFEQRKEATDAQRLVLKRLRSITSRNVSWKGHKGFHMHRPTKHANRMNYTGANGDVDAAVLCHKLKAYLRHYDSLIHGEKNSCVSCGPLLLRLEEGYNGIIEWMNQRFDRGYKKLPPFSKYHFLE